MKLTPQQLRETADAIEAVKARKPIQMQMRGGSWMDINITAEEMNLNFDLGYRPKPEPVTRPWSKPEDVPGPVCWLREYRSATICLFVGMGCDGFSISTGGNYKWNEFTNGKWEHSTDRITWKPCTTEEAK